MAAVCCVGLLRTSSARALPVVAVILENDNDGKQLRKHSTPCVHDCDRLQNVCMKGVDMHSSICASVCKYLRSGRCGTFGRSPFRGEVGPRCFGSDRPPPPDTESNDNDKNDDGVSCSSNNNNRNHAHSNKQNTNEGKIRIEIINV